MEKVLVIKNKYLPLYRVKELTQPPGRVSGTKRLSKKGRRADALALRADEGRDKLRKATGSCT